jgi:hypothetical protein
MMGTMACECAWSLSVGSFVIARLAQRLSKTRLGMDDYMIMASLAASGLLSMTECQGRPFTLFSIVVLVRH